MKILLNKFYMIWKKYVTLNRRLHQKVTTFSTLKAMFFSLIMSLVIMLIPVLIIINLFIFTKLTLFLAICLTLMFMIWCYLYYKLYFTLLMNYHPEVEKLNLKHIYYVETTIINVIILIFGIIIMTTFI